MNVWNEYPLIEPPKEKDLLVYVVDGKLSFDGESYMAIDRYIEWDDSCSFRSTRFSYGIVIAWMELPKPPERNSNESRELHVLDKR